jgi:hypothetical protein
MARTGKRERNIIITVQVRIMEMLTSRGNYSVSKSQCP